MATSDPRYVIKNILDEMTFNKDDDATSAVLLFMYSDSGEFLEDLFDDYDVVFTLGPPTMIERRFIGDIPVHERYEVPVTVASIDKTGVTGSFMLWKADIEIRAKIEASVHPGAGVTITVVGIPRPDNRKVGGITVWQSIYTIRYET